MKSTTLVFVLVAAVAFCAATPVPDFPAYKTGTCPAGPPVIGTCAITSNSCEFDNQCTANQKCCSNGCGKICVDPNFLPNPPRPAPVQPIKKGGVCPANDVIGTCVITENNCQSDVECSGDLLCCSSGCGRSCVKPTRQPIQPIEKPGDCPANDSFGVCVFDPEKNCLSDSVCPGSQKCCPNGCNRACTNVRRGPAHVQF